MLNLNVEDTNCRMEIDTGAAVSTMTLQVQEKLLPKITVTNVYRRNNTSKRESQSEY